MKIEMRDFIAEDDPILRDKAEPVSFPLDDETRKMALSMRQFLIDSQDPEIAEKRGLRGGVGVAAPQLGLSKRFFAIYLVEKDEEDEEVLIDQIFFNPKITRHSLSKAYLEGGEGCLSVPRAVPGVVPRCQRVTLEYQDIDGESHVARFKDYEGIIVQHEMDHLDGILFYDHINPSAPWVAEVDWKQI